MSPRPTLHIILAVDVVFRQLCFVVFTMESGTSTFINFNAMICHKATDRHLDEITYDGPRIDLIQHDYGYRALNSQMSSIHC